MDVRRQYAYDIIIFLSRNLFQNYFTCCIRTHVVYLRLLGVVLLTVNVETDKRVSDSIQSREKVTGSPQLLAVGSNDRFLPVEMCRFSAVTGTITHCIFNLRKPLYYAVQQANFKPAVSGTEISESQHWPIPVYHSFTFVQVSNGSPLLSVC